MLDRALFAGASGIALALTIACGSADNRTINLTNADTGRVVVAAVGDTIEVTLQTIGPGQYTDPIVSSGVVMFLGEFTPDVQNPGGPRQVYRFEVMARRHAEISIPHTGEIPVGPAVLPFAFTVEVG